jgi:hypothetical protein
VFAALAAACFVFARQFAKWREGGWASYSGVTGVLIAIGFLGFAYGFSATTPLTQIAGLLQRLTIAVGWLWVTLLAGRMLRIRRDPA